MNPIGVFGGTFDPIHNGHITPVLETCQRTGIREVHYIPNSRPGHRLQPASDATHRWNMTMLALEKHPELVADDREIRRAGKSYMVPTLRSMRRQFGFRPLCLILGIDAFLEIHRWYWWADVLRLANIVVMNRPGFSLPPRIPNWWLNAIRDGSRALFDTMSGGICHVQTTPVNVSATDVRRKLSRGESVDNLVPPAVSRYLAEHGLYSNSGELK